MPHASRFACLILALGLMALDKPARQLPTAGSLAQPAAAERTAAPSAEPRLVPLVLE